MEIPDDDLAQESIHAAIWENDHSPAPTAPSRSDLFDVLRRLPTREELSRVFRDLSPEELRVALRSMKENLSSFDLGDDVLSGRPTSNNRVSGSEPGESSPIELSANKEEQKGPSASEQSRNAVAASMAQAICEVHKKPVRLARKTSENWGRLSRQVRTDVLKILLAYESTLKQMVRAFDDLGPEQGSG